MSDFLYDLCGKPFGWIMRLIYDLVDNYALAILLFTIFTKLILFPISYKQQKNSAKMQRFNPKLEKLRKKTGQVETMLAITGYLDMAISVGGFRKSLEGYCIPKLEEDTEKAFLHMKKGWHPLLSQPVKNSIRADRGILLTGSNASGKSTFLKMVAVNAVLAQTIHTCAAESYHAPIFQIFSSMALRDSMENGESYYIVEIRSLKRILDAAGERRTPVLCFVDEVLRGTNTVERIAAATQILIRLAESGTLGFAATHDIEMTELLKEYYDNYHFEEVIRDGDILFPYQLLPGKHPPEMRSVCFR